MAKILCLETATTNCSVALSDHGSVIAFKEDNSKKYSHAESLHNFIEEVLKEANLSKENLDGVAVSMGPGSYTGLRIGVSAAKGLCFALDIPLLAIPTLQSLAYKTTLSGDYVIPMLDARRMEVYSAVFNADLEPLRETRAEIVEEGSFSDYLDKGKVVFIGSGTEKLQKICSHKNAQFQTEIMPSAVEMASLAQEKWLKKGFEDVAYFEPYYLKDFISG